MNQLPLTGNYQPSSEEQVLFDELWLKATDPATGRVQGKRAFDFFLESGLAKDTLRNVWEIADATKVHSLGRSEFYNALRMIALVQQGIREPLSVETIARAEGLGPLLPQPWGSQIQLTASANQIHNNQSSEAESLSSEKARKDFEPKFKKGDKVIHTKSTGLVRIGEIVGVHTDDLVHGVYYTVRTDGDHEFQTDEKRLSYPDSPRRDSGAAAAGLPAGVSAPSPTSAHLALPGEVPSSSPVPLQQSNVPLSAPASTISAVGGGGSTSNLGATWSSWGVDRGQIAKYLVVFEQCCPGSEEMDRTQAQQLFSKSGLSPDTVGHLWRLCSVGKRLSKSEFAVAFHMAIGISRKGMAVPDTLPGELLHYLPSEFPPSNNLEANKEAMNDLQPLAQTNQSEEMHEEDPFASITPQTPPSSTPDVREEFSSFPSQATPPVPQPQVAQEGSVWNAGTQGPVPGMRKEHVGFQNGSYTPGVTNYIHEQGITNQEQLNASQMSGSSEIQFSPSLDAMKSSDQTRDVQSTENTQIPHPYKQPGITIPIEPVHRPSENAFMMTSQDVNLASVGAPNPSLQHTHEESTSDQDVFKHITPPSDHTDTVPSAPSIDQDVFKHITPPSDHTDTAPSAPSNDQDVFKHTTPPSDHTDTAPSAPSNVESAEDQLASGQRLVAQSDNSLDPEGAPPTAVNELEPAHPVTVQVCREVLEREDWGLVLQALGVASAPGNASYSKADIVRKFEGLLPPNEATSDETEKSDAAAEWLQFLDRASKFAQSKSEAMACLEESASSSPLGSLGETTKSQLESRVKYCMDALSTAHAALEMGARWRNCPETERGDLLSVLQNWETMMQTISRNLRRTKEIVEALTSQPTEATKHALSSTELCAHVKGIGVMVNISQCLVVTSLMTCAKLQSSDLSRTCDEVTTLRQQLECAVLESNAPALIRTWRSSIINEQRIAELLWNHCTKASDNWCKLTWIPMEVANELGFGFSSFGGESCMTPALNFWLNMIRPSLPRGASSRLSRLPPMLQEA